MSDQTIPAHLHPGKAPPGWFYRRQWRRWNTCLLRLKIKSRKTEKNGAIGEIRVSGFDSGICHRGNSGIVVSVLTVRRQAIARMQGAA